MATTKRRKPDFSSVQVNWVGPQLLSDESRRLLTPLLPSGWSTDEKSSYLDAVAEKVFVFDPVANPLRDSLKRLEEVASAAHRLMNCLSQWDKNDSFRFAPRYGELVHMRKYAGRLPPEILFDAKYQQLKELGGLLNMAWHASEALMALNSHSSESIQLTRQTRPSQAEAKVLVRQLIAAHVQTFQRKPAGGWFYGFAEEVANQRGLKAKRDLVDAARKEA